MVSNQCVPPTHTWFHYGEGIYHITLVGFLALCGLVQNLMSQSFNKPTNQMLSCCFMNCSFCFVFFFCVFFLQCHLKQSNAHEHRKQKLLSVRIWLCVLNGLQPLIWAQQKSPSIAPLIVRLSAYLSSPPSTLPLPCLLPSIHPSTPPSSAQGLIDQPCPGSCPLISQLDVFCVWVKWINYWANRTASEGPAEPGLGPRKQDGGMRWEKRKEQRCERREATEGLGRHREDDEGGYLAHFSAW